MNKTLVLTILVSASAFAQEAAPPPPPPPAAPMAVDTPVAEEDPGNRVRWGFSVDLGWHIPTPAFVGGVEGHFGWQFSRLFAAYAILGSHFGLGFNAAVSGSSAKGGITAFGAWYGGAIAEVTLADIFYVGAGGLIGSGGYAGVQVGVNSATRAQEVKTLAQGGLMFGLDARLGLGLGRRNPTTFRRGGFNIGLDMMVLFRPNTVVVTETSDGMGGFSGGVTTNTLTASVIPMLTLGYDAR